MQDECAVCEGRFAYNEVIIELRGVKYCEACYEDIKKAE